MRNAYRSSKGGFCVSAISIMCTDNGGSSVGTVGQCFRICQSYRTTPAFHRTHLLLQPDTMSFSPYYQGRYLAVDINQYFLLIQSSFKLLDSDLRVLLPACPMLSPHHHQKSHLYPQLLWSYSKIRLLTRKLSPLWLFLPIISLCDTMSHQLCSAPFSI